MTDYRFLPPDLPAERVAACMGLISDTHMPERCEALPQAVFEALAGVDLVLHAGDVGELWVLDRLSEIAPVVAVHGNDDTAESQRELPYQQVMVVRGQRILLTHSHYPDREEEMAARRDDAWAPKRARWAARARRAGAGVMVFGHTHIPMVWREDGVLLVNPGAIASSGYITRQRVQSVALLFVRDDGEPFVTYVDLGSGVQFQPEIAWKEGFAAALRRSQASILSPDLEAVWEEWWGLRHVAPEEARAAILRAARPCWSGEQAAVTRADLRAALQADTDLPGAPRAQLEAPLVQE